MLIFEPDSHNEEPIMETNIVDDLPKKFNLEVFFDGAEGGCWWAAHWASDSICSGPTPETAIANLFCAVRFLTPEEKL